MAKSGIFLLVGVSFHNILSLQVLLQAGTHRLDQSSFLRFELHVVEDVGEQDKKPEKVDATIHLAAWLTFIWGDWGWWPREDGLFEGLNSDRAIIRNCVKGSRLHRWCSRSSTRLPSIERNLFQPVIGDGLNRVRQLPVITHTWSFFSNMSMNLPTWEAVSPPPPPAAACRAPPQRQQSALTTLTFPYFHSA